MSREFTEKRVPESKVELRDFIAMMMPEPPHTLESCNDKVRQFLHQIKERYAMADKIIGEIR